MNSSIRSSLREWLFKGLSAEAALDGLERDGVAIRSSNDPAAIQRVLPLEDFSATIRRSSMQALPAYLAFFCFENSARELVAERLADRHGSGWWTSVVPKAIRDRVSARQGKEGVHRWHVSRGASEIYYSDFGDVSQIIQTNWSDFEDLFPDQNWVISRLADLEASRNIVAHSNILDERELTRIRVYLTDWMKQIG